MENKEAELPTSKEMAMSGKAISIFCDEHENAKNAGTDAVVMEIEVDSS